MCCTALLKTIMFIFNGVIFLAGAVVLALGIWLKVDSESFLGIVNNIEGAPSELSILASVSYLLIGVGAFLLIIGFLGCCGAVKESRCMLLTFFCLVLIVFLAEVAGAVVILVFDDVVSDVLADVETDVVGKIRNDYGNKENVDLTNFWDTTMNQLVCCGYRNFTDFDGSPFTVPMGFYPEMCCTQNFNSSCRRINAKESDVMGCLDRLVALIEQNTPIVAGVALGIAALEIAAMVVSMILYKDIGYESRRK